MSNNDVFIVIGLLFFVLVFVAFVQSFLHASSEPDQPDQPDQPDTPDLLLTTETAHNLPVVERLGVVTVETVMGVSAIKDAMADLRGAVGGRSKTMQRSFADTRTACFHDLKVKAAELGADAIVGVDLDYLDVGTSGKMLVVVATGTAVRLSQTDLQTQA